MFSSKVGRMYFLNLEIERSKDTKWAKFKQWIVDESLCFLYGRMRELWLSYMQPRNRGKNPAQVSRSNQDSLAKINTACYLEMKHAWYIDFSTFWFPGEHDYFKCIQFIIYFIHFIHPSIHSLIHSSIHLFIYSFIHYFTHLLTCWLKCSLACSSVHLFRHYTFIHLFSMIYLTSFSYLSFILQYWKSSCHGN